MRAAGSGLGLTPEHEQGDVVLGRPAADQVLHHRGADRIRGLRGHRPAETGQPVVDHLTPALDQAVGEKAQQGAGRDRHRGYRPARLTGQADHQARRGAGQLRRLSRTCDDRREVPGQAHVHLVQAGLDDRVQHGGHCLGLEVLDLAVEPVQDLSRVPGLQRVRAQRTAHPAHDDRGRQARPGHVADHHAQFPRRQSEHVVPVPADPAAARDEPGGHLGPGHGGQRGRDQTALQRGRREAIGPGRHGLHRGRGPVRGKLQELDVRAGEPAGPQRAHVQHADHPASGHHRHAHHGLDALGQQDRVEHGGVVDVIQDHRLVLGGDPPGEPAAHRDAHALVHFLFQPRGRGRDQLPGLNIQQQRGRGIGLQGFPGAFHQLREQVVVIQAR
jgi:hypothetical protein